MDAKTKAVQIMLAAILMLGVLAGALTPMEVEARAARTIDDALILMATSELWLTGGGEPVEAIRRGGSPGLPRA